jgi:pimeloyl-ACP methyl ester carboxylesterase
MVIVYSICLFVSTFKICDHNDKTGSSPPPSKAEDFAPSRYMRRTNSDTVIVFVHGIFGGSVGTWTNAQNGAYWPKLILDDDAFKDSDVYVYSYPTPYLDQSYTIDELIENMRLVIDNDEVFTKHKRVIFVCHSMGGLVVRGFITRYQANASKVPLIYFFSTPTSGSHITQLAKFLSKNPQLKGMVPAGSGTYVTNLQHDWRALPVPVNSHCAYEIRDTYGVRIVDEQSATALCDGPVNPVDSNHIDIVKPRDKNDVPYLAFRTEFNAVQQAEANRNKTNPPSGGAKSTVGTLQTARSVEVDCGQTREDTAGIPPPIEVKPEQKVLQAVASLQEASNLKEQQVEVKGLENQTAKVHYRLVGLDRPNGGGCPVKGYGIILVTFLVSQPAEMVTVGFTPIENNGLFVALSQKSGTLAFNVRTKIPSLDAYAVSPRETLVTRDQVFVKHIGVQNVIAK